MVTATTKLPATRLAPPSQLMPPPPATVRVHFRQLQPSKLNPRKTFDQEGIRELAESIHSAGLLENLLVRPLAGAAGSKGEQKFEIIAGERRRLAISLLVADGRWDDAAPSVDVRVIAHASDAAFLAMALMENLQREDVNAMEEAEAFEQLRHLDPKKWNAQGIADAIGCSRRHVEQRLALVKKLDDTVKAALRTGKIKASHARVMTAVKPAEQAYLLKAAQDGASVEQLRREVTNDMVPVSRAIFEAAKSGLKIVELDNGALYFADSTAFMQAQEKAVTAKLAQLRKEWAWAELEEQHFYAGHYGKSDDRKKAGCIVEIEHDGTVRIHLGLLRPEDTVHRSAAGAGERKETEAQKQKRLRADATAKALDTVAEGLTKRLRADPLDVLRLYLFDALRDDSGILGGYSNAVDPELLEAVGLIAQVPDDCDAADLGDLWQRLQAFSGPGLLHLVAVAMLGEQGIAGHEIREWVDGSTALSPTGRMLARHFKLDLPKVLQADQLDLEEAIAGKTKAAA